MNRAAFYAGLRKRDSGVFGTSLSKAQVEGMDALLDEGKGLPLHHMANVMAQVYHETGGGMCPIKETVMPHHKDKNPSDAEVIRRLDRAFAAGQLPWVRAPYWRGGWFGRGQLQITHEANYRNFHIVNPDDALKMDVSARVAVSGMKRGMFTGKKLADYDFPDALDNPPASNPRRIVNGRDGTDATVAGYHRAFAAALQAGGWSQAPSAPADQPGLLARILAALAAIFGGRK